jgi:signal transduction histidine kinase
LGPGGGGGDGERDRQDQHRELSQRRLLGSGLADPNRSAPGSIPERFSICLEGLPAGLPPVKGGVLRRVPAPVAIGAGFLIGLFLASLDKLLAPVQSQGPYVNAFIEAVDWIAPPLAGALLAGAVLYGMRHKRLLEAERAASQVLAERLAGTERRQALWVVAAAVAHDLKNPLHNLSLIVEDLYEERTREEREALLLRARENLDRANERIKELARAGTAPAEDEEGSIDLHAALEATRHRLLPNAALSRTQIAVECPRGLRVRGDSLAVRSAVENVAANSLEALHERGGSLLLRCQPAAESPGTVELLIEDDGPGIADELQPRLFVPFAASHPGSTGLGLAIARALARSVGGELVLADTRPGRTRFRFTFHAR